MRRAPAAMLRALVCATALALAPACGDGAEVQVARGAPDESAAPEPIRFGEDRCSITGEPIERKRYGAELVTRDGTVKKFRSAECLARHLLENPGEPIESLWVIDFNHGTRLIDVGSAIFLVSEKMEGPDPLNLLAVADERLAFNLHFAYGGRQARWEEVLALAEQHPGGGRELCAASSGEET